MTLESGHRETILNTLRDIQEIENAEDALANKRNAYGHEHAETIEAEAKLTAAIVQIGARKNRLKEILGLRKAEPEFCEHSGAKLDHRA